MSAPKCGTIAVVQHEGRFLLVKRKNPPNAGTWGFPGGHIEFGETGLSAAIRELHEETGIRALAEDYLTNIDIITRDDGGHILFHYLLAVVRCTYQSGTAKAGDDASAAGWFTPDEAKTLNGSAHLQDIIKLAST